MQLSLPDLDTGFRTGRDLFADDRASRLIDELRTRADIEGYFDEGILFWRQNCSGKKIYVVVDYNNLTSNPDEIDFYATQVKRVISECAMTVVRHNGGMLQRMNGRMTAIRLHTPSNTYSSLQEAIAVVRGLRQGTIRSASPPR